MVKLKVINLTDLPSVSNEQGFNNECVRLRTHEIKSKAIPHSLSDFSKSINVL